MVNSQQGEIQLSDDQANQSSFPPNCPVYILYDDDDGIDAQGIVHSIILRRNPTTRAYTECYKINVKCKDDNGDFYSREDIVDFSQLRYRHGCHVTLVMKNNGEALANHGKVLGVISNASVNNKASGKPNQYWYCVQEVGKTRRTHHKVLPEQLKYHHVLGNEVNAKVEEDDDNENVALVTEPSSNIDDNVGEGSPRAVPVQIDLCNDERGQMSIGENLTNARLPCTRNTGRLDKSEPNNSGDPKVCDSMSISIESSESNSTLNLNDNKFDREFRKHMRNRGGSNDDSKCLRNTSTRTSESGIQKITHDKFKRERPDPCQEFVCHIHLPIMKEEAYGENK